MRFPTRVVVLALTGAITACGRWPLLADGPIDLSERPTTLRFIKPVESEGEMWELCFEFDLPRDSHRASSIHATLITSRGGRGAILTPTLDRRGESVVCHVGKVAAPEQGTERALYDSAELSSDEPLRLRAIRGGSRS